MSGESYHRRPPHRQLRGRNSNASRFNNNHNGIGIVSALSSTPLASIPFHLRRNSINDLICGLTVLSPLLSFSHCPFLSLSVSLFLQYLISLFILRLLSLLLEFAPCISPLFPSISLLSRSLVRSLLFSLCRRDLFVSVSIPLSSPSRLTIPVTSPPQSGFKVNFTSRDRALRANGIV